MGGPAAVAVACAGEVAGAGVVGVVGVGVGVGAAAAGGAEDEDEGGDAAPSLPLLLLLAAPSVDDVAAPDAVPSFGDLLDSAGPEAGLAVAGGRGGSGGLLLLVRLVLAHVLVGAGIGTNRRAWT